MLVVLATAFVAWSCHRADLHPGLPLAVLSLGGLVLARLFGEWRRARRLPVRRLEAQPDGSIWLHQAGGGPCVVTVERGTRLLGPSAFLDLRVACTQAPRRLQCWITPFDAPGHVMRQWSVLLPLGRRAAGA
jgi:hypothetical protein